MTEREKKHRKELQKIWDANGAAIYEANKTFESEHGHKMDSAARNQAIAEATVGGVFNAGLYSVGLTEAQEEEEAKRIAALRAQQEAILAEKRRRHEEQLAREAEQERKEKAQSLADWKRDDMRAAEDYQEDKELQEGLRAYYEGRKAGEDGKYQGDVLADYHEGQDWVEKALTEPYLNPQLTNYMFPEPEGTLTLRERISKWLAPRAESLVRHPPSFLSVSYQKDMRLLNQVIYLQMN